MKKISPIFLIAILFFSCQKNENEKIRSVEILYYNALFESIIEIDCDEIVYKPIAAQDTCKEYVWNESLPPKQAVILDTIVIDKKILHEIRMELNKREGLKDNIFIDARMKCLIIRTNGKVDTLCLSEDPILGIYNNQPVRLTNKFAYLIRQYCGFYNWIGIDQMQYLEELNDSSFLRDKVTSITGDMY